MLGAYREAGGEDAVLLIHDGGLGAELAPSLLERWGHLLPLTVEEVASLGMELWLSALAYGARAVRLVDTLAVPGRSRREIDAQIGYAAALLGGLGLPEDAVGWLADGPDGVAPVMPELAPARHAAIGGKRQILFAALDHLTAVAPAPLALTDLPTGAPFGEVSVDEQACTLCLACVTVCPGKALQDGHDRPQLRFIEGNCVQCELCARACPENAIRISPRFLFDAKARTEPRVLREDSPFHCVTCGKPFATTAVIGRMQQRLADHSMFREPEARRRLQMCGDCRVADMMRS
jgi:ferredoxin